MYGIAAIQRATSRQMLQTFEATLMTEATEKQRTRWMRDTRMMAGI